MFKNPILTLFLVIGGGLPIGRIPIWRIRFGVAGILFMGIIVGSLFPEATLPELIPTLGLVVFVYTIGLETGQQFFKSFPRQGLRDAALTLIVLCCGAIAVVIITLIIPLSPEVRTGLFCGALTNTPALAAVRESLLMSGSSAAEAPVVKYSIAYPFGVIGVVIAVELYRSFLKPAFAVSNNEGTLYPKDYTIKNPALFNRRLKETLSLFDPQHFLVTRVKHSKTGIVNIVSGETVLNEDDIVVVVADDTGHKQALQLFGEANQSFIEEDRSSLDYRRIYVSNPAVVGRSLKELDLPLKIGAVISRLKRGDIDIVPHGDTELEMGDRVRVLTNRENFAAASKFFGDSIKGSAHADYGSMALGMALGVIVGLIPIPLPFGNDGSVFKLGLAGGALITAMILGTVKSTFSIRWSLPLPANLTLREFGLLLFLAGVGLHAGHEFIPAFLEYGIPLLLGGIVTTWTVTFGTLLIGTKIFRLDPDYLLGILSGIHTQPSVLAHVTGLTDNEIPNKGYASVFPVATLLKILLAHILITLM
jgi:putative transport protein